MINKVELQLARHELVDFCGQKEITAEEAKLETHPLLGFQVINANYLETFIRY